MSFNTIKIEPFDGKVEKFGIERLFIVPDDVTTFKPFNPALVYVGLKLALLCVACLPFPLLSRHSLTAPLTVDMVERSAASSHTAGDSWLGVHITRALIVTPVTVAGVGVRVRVNSGCQGQGQVQGYGSGSRSGLRLRVKGKAQN